MYCGQTLEQLQIKTMRKKVSARSSEKSRSAKTSDQSEGPKVKMEKEWRQRLRYSQEVRGSEPGHMTLVVFSLIDDRQRHCVVCLRRLVVFSVGSSASPSKLPMRGSSELVIS